jgi:hypothetical protein
MEVGKALNAPGGSRNGSVKLGGGRAGGVDLGTDLPDDTRALLMYVSPSIDSVERLHSLRIPADKLSEERER